MNNPTDNSSLNQLIPPEIKNDEFYAAIQKLAREENITTVLEIGSSSGEGSTEAFVTGLRDNPNHPTLYCMEVSQTRFAQLQKTYSNDDFVKCYNVSSVSLESFPDEQEIIDFYNSTQTNLNLYPLDVVLSWLQQDIEYVKNSGVAGDGIKIIKQENNIGIFDLALIDGSEFTGNVELADIYGAKIICLDDIVTFKNYYNHQKLLKDPNYILITENTTIRNGYSIFKKIDNSELPINFFTIVLNGQPFIKYHIDIFKQLPFQWHWHIIEGVADLKHDTSWSLRLGGKITDKLHKNGRSYDGTTEYLDEIAKLYSDNITIYRQSEGVFWDGKKAMVNAPLVNIHEECLLWQIDVDELWTLEQICTTRKLFISHPEKTAAFYWCWYFVGENLIISTRNCYAQNPQQDWLRTWRFKPGAFWAAHEPPILLETLADGSYQNIGTANPFLHQDTEKQDLIFQHFAYITPEQLQFKEEYYGYNNAVAQWQNLQTNTKFPTFLRDYFAWVGDETRVDIAESCGVIPIAQKENHSNIWQFLRPEELEKQRANIQKPKPIILLDGVFFQLHKNGVARVWQSLLETWANTELSKHIIVLDRDGTAPKISGIKYKHIPSFDYNHLDADQEMLQQVCDNIGAELFISSYYTIPLTTPSIFMAYDMIPEVLGADLSHPSLKAKHQAIEHALKYISISENTARDLHKLYPQIPLNDITIAYCGVGSNFQPAKIEEINSFKIKYGINKPYFLLVVSAGGGYKNGILFFKAFAQLASKPGFDLICTGVGGVLDDEYRAYTSGVNVQMLQLSDAELIIAYSGAVALVYPSKYEGFGMPIAEALACGCPVITCPNASIPEVAGNAAIYVKDNDVNGLANALCEVQKPSLRKALISAGLEQSKKFSWTKMAAIISDTLINATLDLNFREINYIIFPNWLQSEESLEVELQELIKTLATHPDSDKINLLIYIDDIEPEEAAMFLSSIAMNLLMEDDLDISEGLAISPVSNLSPIQWQVLLTHIMNRIILQQEDKDALELVGVAKIPVLNL